jgi:hypothetical protein
VSATLVPFPRGALIAACPGCGQLAYERDVLRHRKCLTEFFRARNEAHELAQRLGADFADFDDSPGAA